MAPRSHSSGSNSGGKPSTPPPREDLDLATVPTPKLSTGRFEEFSRPDSDFLADIRSGHLPKTANEPTGFPFDGSVCYRNSVLIMLLTCDRFMNYVRNTHVASVETIRPEHEGVCEGDDVPPGNAKEQQSRGRSRSMTSQERSRSSSEKGRASSITRAGKKQSDGGDAGEAKVSQGKTPYNDIFMELNRLWEVYWSKVPQGKHNKAMNAFWRYVQSANDRRPCSKQEREGEQDVDEFLGWILSTFRYQLEEEANLVGNVNYLNQLVHVGHTSRRLCSRCSRKELVKHRMPDSDLQDHLALDLTEVITGSTIVSRDIRRPLQLADLLRYSIDRPAETWLCDKCEKERHAKKASMDDKSKPGRASDTEYAKNGRQWVHLCVLPEVLFTRLNRWLIKQGSISKDETEVEIVEEIGVAPVLEKTMPAAQRKNTRYRLKSVISHAGSFHGSGHYRTYVKNKDGDLGEWRLIDGTSVKNVTLEDINRREYYKKDRRGKESEPWTPYFLCWERIVDEPSVPEPEAVKEPESTTRTRPRGSKSQSKSPRNVHFDDSATAAHDKSRKTPPPAATSAKSSPRRSPRGTVGEVVPANGSTPEAVPTGHDGPRPSSVQHGPEEQPAKTSTSEKQTRAQPCDETEAAQQTTTSSVSPKAKSKSYTQTAANKPSSSEAPPPARLHGEVEIGGRRYTFTPLSIPNIPNIGSHLQTGDGPTVKIDVQLEIPSPWSNEPSSVFFDLINAEDATPKKGEKLGRLNKTHLTKDSRISIKAAWKAAKGVKAKATATKRKRDDVDAGEEPATKKTKTAEAEATSRKAAPDTAAPTKRQSPTAMKRKTLPPVQGPSVTSERQPPTQSETRASGGDSGSVLQQYQKMNKEMNEQSKSTSSQQPQAQSDSTDDMAPVPAGKTLPKKEKKTTKQSAKVKESTKTQAPPGKKTKASSPKPKVGDATAAAGEAKAKTTTKATTKAAPKTKAQPQPQATAKARAKAPAPARAPRQTRAAQAKAEAEKKTAKGTGKNGKNEKDAQAKKPRTPSPAQKSKTSSSEREWTPGQEQRDLETFLTAKRERRRKKKKKKEKELEKAFIVDEEDDDDDERGEKSMARRKPGAKGKGKGKAKVNGKGTKRKRGVEEGEEEEEEEDRGVIEEEDEEEVKPKKKKAKKLPKSKFVID